MAKYHHATTSPSLKGQPLSTSLFASIPPRENDNYSDQGYPMNIDIEEGGMDYSYGEPSYTKSAKKANTSSIHFSRRSESPHHKGKGSRTKVRTRGLKRRDSQLNLTGISEDEITTKHNKRNKKKSSSRKTDEDDGEGESRKSKSSGKKKKKNTRRKSHTSIDDDDPPDSGGHDQHQQQVRSSRGQGVPIGNAKPTSALIPTPPSSTTAKSSHTHESYDNTSSGSENLLDLSDDVYNMFFLSNTFGPAFFYAVYIYLLKLSLYTVIAIHLYNQGLPNETETLVKVTQFLLLPVAVAIQEDLISCFFVVANMEYSPSVLAENPGASQWKYTVSNLCRGFDGLYCLGINFIVLLQASDVLSLFLNFAALQFLQTIDNVALHLAADGYLAERLEVVADKVATTKLPRKENRFFNALDSVLFLSTLGGLFAAYIAHTITQGYNSSDDDIASSEGVN